MADLGEGSGGGGGAPTPSALAQGMADPIRHITPEKFETEIIKVFILKMHQMLSVHAMQVEFKNAKVIGHFRFVFEENSVRQTK